MEGWKYLVALTLALVVFGAATAVMGPDLSAGAVAVVLVVLAVTAVVWVRAFRAGQNLGRGLSEDE